jgi:O-antigen ligase
VKLRSYQANNKIVSYILAMSLGLLVGFKFIPPAVVAYVYFAVLGIAIFRCIQGNVPAFFSILPYAMYAEIFMRAFNRWVPYLTLQYAIIFCFIILMVRTGMKRSHFTGYVLLLLFTFVELANNIYPDKVDVSRAIITNSIALLVPAVWASFHVLKPLVINRLLNNIKIACVFLAGVVYVAHISGKIDYGLFSNSDASNGLAPVQLSAYIGFGCILFFLSLMNVEESKHRWLNILLLAFCATIMVLTFSRGGVYFVAAIVALYLYYNRAKSKNYIIILLFIPVGLFIYNYVVSQTAGKIVERYQQEGTSSRDQLVKIGFRIFQAHPYTGVGTGNYNTTILKQNLFGVESGAHNEFVRAAAEHGIVGIIFYWGFFIMLIINILRRKQPQQQYAMYFVVLLCMIIVHNGLKISIQPILLMLAIATPSFVSKQQKNVTHRLYSKRIVAAGS